MPDNSRTQFRDPKVERAIEWMRRWSHTLDKAFRVPGTKMRFGWDPIIGLIPGLGEISTGLFSLFLLLHAFRLRVPGIIKARMILNVLIDVVSGAIPFLGDVFDFVWKSNTRNLYLLEKHAGSGVKPGLWDWLFVLGILAAVLAILVLPIIILAAIWREVDLTLPVKSLF